MKIIELREMAAPRDSDKGRVYYHGTDTEASARGILEKGLDPDLTVVKYGTKRSQLRPEANSIYITTDLSYAMIYGLGANMFGSNAERFIPTLGEYGFVFEIEGGQLADIGPDEDSVGELIYKFANKRVEADDPHYRTLARLNTLALNKLTDNQYRKVKEGDYPYFASSGKKLNAIMPDDLKLALIDAGSHLSHKGRLMTSKCWRFSRKDVPDIKRDGSNFFDYAKEWKP